ncbi:MAG TPA: metallophosphoesterase family protein [Aquella sp.]|nr:metallophosphoesterase family protein [Aquella sp.]
MTIENHRNLYLVSDTHFSHKFCSNIRGFATTEEMNQTLIKNWNTKVSPADLVFHLGDFCFGNFNEWERIRKQLNGQIILIKGNHDKLQDTKIQPLFKSIHSSYLEIKVLDKDALNGKYQPITLSHYAMRTWNKQHYFSYSLYGHSHGNLPDDPNALSMDVGLDAVTPKYFPISYNQVKEILSKKTFKPVDHHK